MSSGFSSGAPENDVDALVVFLVLVSCLLLCWGSNFSVVVI